MREGDKKQERFATDVEVVKHNLLKPILQSFPFIFSGPLHLLQRAGVVTVMI